MLSIRRQRYGVSIQEVYFPASPCPLVDCDLRVEFCHQQAGRYHSPLMTSMINLHDDGEQILGKFRRSYRREIHGSEGQDEFVVSFTRDPRPQHIQAFGIAYDYFAQQQKLPPCNLNKLLFFAGQGSLILSSIRCAHSGHVLCQHAFIGDQERARLLHSLSDFRLYPLNSFQRNRVGRAHRLLHWADIQQFQQAGYHWYDLGGIAIPEATHLQNINHFKQGFGGELWQEYVNFIPMNLKGWLAMQYLKRQL
ncbi:MAG: hypothetical protein R3E95_00970 [Thiolinea sp.]